ncbi:pilus assembly PilX family protein [Thermoanaerobacter mathranii]|uniref:pilus assembly PilX family protein n=1 Tax=Thermoanaerobacter mathranii TaxID=583357 RepID=UPI003D6A719C
MLSERGSALIFTLMVILILSVLAVAILEITITNYKISYAYANSISATYAAEAGLEKAKSEFNSDLLNTLSNIVRTKINANAGKVSNEVLTQDIYRDIASYLQQNVFSKYPQTGYLGDNGQKYTVKSISLDSNYVRMTYTIHIYAEGEYKNFKKEGYAQLIINLESLSPLTVSKWEIK